MKQELSSVVQVPGSWFVFMVPVHGSMFGVRGSVFASNRSGTQNRALGIASLEREPGTRTRTLELGTRNRWSAS